MRTLSICIAALLASMAAAQTEKVITWMAALQPDKKDANVLHLYVRGEIARGWHIYGMESSPDVPYPTSFVVKAPSLKLGKSAASEASLEYDGTVGKELPLFTDEVIFRTPITLRKDKRPSDVTIEISYQACDGQKCLRPTTDVVKYRLTWDAKKSVWTLVPEKKKVAK